MNLNRFNERISSAEESRALDDAAKDGELFIGKHGEEHYSEHSEENHRDREGGQTGAQEGDPASNQAAPPATGSRQWKALYAAIAEYAKGLKSKS